MTLPTYDAANNINYTWNNTLASNGRITVQTATPAVNTNPTNITAVVSGNTLELSWPPDHKGWTLQTNAVGIAAAGAWFDYPPDTGSRDTNKVTFTIDRTKTNVFFRLVYP